ncbi:hypothetical protein ABPG75_007572 [Micractinium tetrahymenae]
MCTLPVHRSRLLEAGSPCRGPPRRVLVMRRHNSTAQWQQLPTDVLCIILGQLSLESRVAATSVCESWRAAALRPGLWPAVEFATHRDGSRRSELRRLLSLAAWAARHAGATRCLAISARLPADAQPTGLKAVSAVALAACNALCELSVTANRGFWPGEWLPRLPLLRSLRLCSKEGGLSLHGELRSLAQLTRLVLEAKHAVQLSDNVRLPPSILSVELSCIRDTLPLQLSQLSGLRSLAVRRGLVSEGVLLTEYECLAHLTALTSLALEQQEEEAWLPPPELLSLTRLRHLSIAGNDCSRWPLHGSDEAFSGMLARMPGLTSLDISCCGLEELPQALLHTAAPADSDSSNSGSVASSELAGEQQEADSSGGALAPPALLAGLEAAAAVAAGAAGIGGAGQGPAKRGPRLLRLLAHGNQLEASAMNGGPEPELLWFPSCVRQLSLDWHVLVQLPLMRLPPRCRQLALIGRDGAMRGMLSALASLPALLPDLRQLLLEPAALDALSEHRCEGPAGPAGPAALSCVGNCTWQMVGGRWRPARLPGQPRPAPAQQDVLQQLQAAKVQVEELLCPEQLAAVLDRLGGQAAGAGGRQG